MSVLRLLMVDDEPEIGVLVKNIVEGLGGYEFCFTSRAADFKKELRSFSPDAIILDLAIPEMDGIELLKFLADENCSARIVLMSGLDMMMRNAARRLGEAYGLNITRIVSKPVRAAGLRVILADLKTGGKFSEG